MRRRVSRRSYQRDRSRGVDHHDPTHTALFCWNKTTACLCCLVVLLAAIQAYVGLLAKDMEQQVEDLQAFEDKLIGRDAQQQAATIHDNQTKPDKYILPSFTLPAWIQNYLKWHEEQRQQFPGRALFDDPGAPKVLIRTCLGLCGGLHDRLGQLGWDLYLANQTGRLLLLHWHRPLALEEFLLPNELDWSVPRDVPGFFGSPRVSRQGLQLVRGMKELFAGYEQESGPEALFWESQFDAAMTRATEGDFKDIKVLRHRLLGHLDQDKLEDRLKALGETDLLHQSPIYGNMFRMFFQLNPNIQRELDNVFGSLKIRPTLSETDNYTDADRYSAFPAYSGVHCRVRHPKATPKNVMIKGKNAEYPADKTGLPWEGETRDFAIETATHALQCAKTLAFDTNSQQQQQQEPLYFFADSNDLVRFMSHELSDPAFLHANQTLLDNNAIAVKARKEVQSMNVVARDTACTQENAHIDRQKGRDAPAYYASFVDLYLAIYARCVTYGIGYYAVFATRISGTQCKLVYQEETWGGSEKKKQTAPMCQLP